MYNSLDWTPEECGRYNTNYGSDNMMQSSRYCYGNKYFNDGDVVNDDDFRGPIQWPTNRGYWGKYFFSNIRTTKTALSKYSRLENAHKQGDLSGTLLLLLP